MSGPIGTSCRLAGSWGGRGEASSPTWIKDRAEVTSRYSAGTPDRTNKCQPSQSQPIRTNQRPTRGRMRKASTSPSARSSAAKAGRPRWCREVQRRRTRSRCQRSSVAGCASIPRQAGRAAAVPAQPAPPGPPSRPAAGSPGVAAPRLRGARRATRRPLPPCSSPAAQATASPGRTADRAVAEPCADHRGPATPLANPQLSAHDRLSGTHKWARTR